MERETGIEPATSSLGSSRSTAELLPPSELEFYQMTGGADQSSPLVQLIRGGYSVRKATVGSTPRARRVGTTQASMHTPNISRA